MNSRCQLGLYNESVIKYRGAGGCREKGCGPPFSSMGLPDKIVRHIRGALSCVNMF